MVVVLSAMAGVTNQLLELSYALREGQLALARQIVDEIEKRHRGTAQALLSEYSESMHRAIDYVSDTSQLLRAALAMPWNIELEKILLAQGELLLDTRYKKEALLALNEHIFRTEMFAHEKAT